MQGACAKTILVPLLAGVLQVYCKPSQKVGITQDVSFCIVFRPGSRRNFRVSLCQRRSLARPRERSSRRRGACARRKRSVELWTFTEYTAVNEPFRLMWVRARLSMVCQRLRYSRTCHKLLVVVRTNNSTFLHRKHKSS